MKLSEYRRLMQQQAEKDRAQGKAARIPKAPSPLEETLALHLRTAGIEFEREYQFHPVRKWRFDFIIVGTNIAIECEGGIYSQMPSHHSITGIERDIEKGNAAVLADWRVLRFTEKAINSGDALRTIEKAIAKTTPSIRDASGET